MHHFNNIQNHYTELYVNNVTKNILLDRKLYFLFFFLFQLQKFLHFFILFCIIHKFY